MSVQPEGAPVSKGRSDTVPNALLVLGIAAGIVALFYRPFGVGPVGFLAVLIGAANSSNRRLGMIATGVVTACFMIGASIAIWDSNALY